MDGETRVRLLLDTCTFLWIVGGASELSSRARVLFVGRDNEVHLSVVTTLHLGRLPPLHRDPFDRMLVCQAIVHGLVILGPDTLITQYPIRAAW